MQSTDFDNIAHQYENIYESSLLRKYDQVFQRDVDNLKAKFEMLINDPATQAMFEKAKSEKGEKYLKKSPENNYKVKVRFRSGVHVSGEKSFLMIMIQNAPTPSAGAAHYNPNNDSIVFNFYLEGFIDVSRISKRFNITEWYKHNAAAIENLLAHELSHMYKTRFHLRKPGSKNLVTPLQVKTGEKNSADYAMYDDEKESYLAEIWKEMQACNTNNSQTFHHCLLQSQTFKKVLRSFGVSSYPHKIDNETSVLSNVEKLQNLDKDYKQLYNYFMKKLYELWQDKGYKFNNVQDQTYTHKLQQFALSYDLDVFNEFNDDEKSKALQTGIEIPLNVFKTLDKALKKTYIDSTPTLNSAVFSQLTQPEQQSYTLLRYKKIIKNGIQNEFDVTLLKKNKRLYDVIMLPEIKKAKQQEQEIRALVKNKIYDGDIRIKSKYILPNLSDIIVVGNFDCSNLGLTSLQGAPKNMAGNFDCSRNNLQTLEHAPKIITEGSFNCSNNNIVNLIGSPTEVDNSFYCTNNHLTSLQNGPRLVKQDFHCEGNPIESLDGMKTRVQGIFFCNQFSDTDFKNRLLKKESIKTLSFKDFFLK